MSSAESHVDPEFREAVRHIEATEEHRHRSITVDLDSGKWSLENVASISPEEAARVAASVLPGADPAKILDLYERGDLDTPLFKIIRKLD